MAAEPTKDFQRLVEELQNEDDNARKRAEEAFSQVPLNEKIPMLLGLLRFPGNEQVNTAAEQLLKGLKADFMVFFSTLSEAMQENFLLDFASCLEANMDCAPVIRSLCRAFAQILSSLMASDMWGRFEKQVSGLLRRFADDERAHWNIFSSITFALTEVVDREHLGSLLNIFTWEAEEAGIWEAEEAGSSNVILVANCLMSLVPSHQNDSQMLKPIKGEEGRMLRSVEEKALSGELDLLNSLITAINLCPEFWQDSAFNLMKMSLRILQAALEAGNDTHLPVVLNFVAQASELTKHANRHILRDANSSKEIIMHLADITEGLLRENCLHMVDGQRPSKSYLVFQAMEQVAEWIIRSYLPLSRKILLSRMSSVTIEQQPDWLKRMAAFILATAGRRPHIIPTDWQCILNGLKHEDQRVRLATGHLLQSMWWLDIVGSTIPFGILPVNGRDDLLTSLLIKHEDPAVRHMAYLFASYPVLGPDPSGTGRRTVNRLLEGPLLSVFDGLTHALKQELHEYYKTGSASSMYYLLTAMAYGWQYCRACCRNCSHKQLVFPLLAVIATTSRDHQGVHHCFEFNPVVSKTFAVLKKKCGDVERLSFAALRCYLIGIKYMEEDSAAAAAHLRWATNLLRELQPVQGPSGFSEAEVGIAVDFVATWRCAIDRSRFPAVGTTLPHEIISLALESLLSVMDFKLHVKRTMDFLEVKELLHSNQAWRSRKFCTNRPPVIIYTGKMKLLGVSREEHDLKTLAIKTLTNILTTWSEVLESHHLRCITEKIAKALSLSFGVEGAQPHQICEKNGKSATMELAEFSARCILEVIEEARNKEASLPISLWTMVEGAFINVLMNPGRIKSLIMLECFEEILELLPEDHVQRLMPKVEGLNLAQ